MASKLCRHSDHARVGCRDHDKHGIRMVEADNASEADATAAAAASFGFG